MREADAALYEAPDCGEMVLPVHAMTPAKTREFAFYYPNPMWAYGDWIKNLVLFFDGIALLVPDYMKELPEEIDRPIVVGLKEQGLLEIITPERAVDKSATEKLATAMTDIITSGVLDELAKEETAFHELSMSRLGWYGDEGLYNMIFDELKKRGLAKESEDKVSIPDAPQGTIACPRPSLADPASLRQHHQRQPQSGDRQPRYGRGALGGALPKD